MYIYVCVHMVSGGGLAFGANSHVNYIVLQLSSPAEHASVVFMFLASSLKAL